MFGGPILEVVEACKKLFIGSILSLLKYVSLCNKSWISVKKFIKSTTQTTQKEATTDSSIMETRARLLIIQYNFDKKLLSCSNVDLEWYLFINFQ